MSMTVIRRRKTMTNEQKEFVVQVRKMCQENYAAGGDTIVECYSDDDIVAQFKTLDEVRDFCGLKVEQELNTRWGEDSDPQLKRMKAFDEWNT